MDDWLDIIQIINKKYHLPQKPTPKENNWLYWNDVLDESSVMWQFECYWIFLTKKIKIFWITDASNFESWGDPHCFSINKLSFL